MTRSFQQRSRNSAVVDFSQDNVDTITLEEAGAYTGAGSDKGVETVVSSGGSTFVERGEKEEHGDEGPGSLLSHVAKMGRRLSAQGPGDPDPQHFTVTKEVFISEERVKVDDAVSAV